MASVDFKKIKTMNELRALIRHDSADTRLQDEHSNTDIDKNRTRQNAQFKDSTFIGTYDRFRNRLAELDKRPGANIKSNRVICFSLEVPIPLELDKKQQSEFTRKTIEILNGQYPAPEGWKSNIVNCYVHRDEQHEYYDSRSGKKRLSMAHLHILIMPVVEGKLNGREFSSRKNMIKLNNAMEDMCQNSFDCKFMVNGKNRSDKGRGLTYGDRVEELKKASAIEAQRQQVERDREAAAVHFEAKENELSQRESEMEAEIERRVMRKFEAREKELAQREKEDERRRKELEEREAKVKKLEASHKESVRLALRHEQARINREREEALEMAEQLKESIEDMRKTIEKLSRYADEAMRREIKKAVERAEQAQQLVDSFTEYIDELEK